MRKMFKHIEKRLKIQHVCRRYVVQDGKARRLTSEEKKFRIPVNPKKKTTFKWIIKTPPNDEDVSNQYSVKYTLRYEKAPEYPRQMWVMKRQCQQRRDGAIALADATFQREKQPPKPFFEYRESKDPELSEKELRLMEEYRTFFEDWDDGDFTEDDCFEMMTESVNKRVSVYEDVYKDTGNPIFLAKACFMKFLDLDRLSLLHRMYLMLSEECGLPMCYVEGILRRHYE